MSLRDTIPLEGELNCWTRDFDVPDVLLRVCATGGTGLLRFVSAEAEKSLFIRKGRIIFATSSSADDRLGEYLLRVGSISLQELSRCGDRVRPGKRLGAILVEEGLLDPPGLVQAVIGQVRSIVLSLFRWTEAWYGFSEQELPSKETITLKMPAAQLVIEGVQMVDSWRRISRGLGDRQGTFRTVSGHAEELRSLDLDTTTLEILASLSRAKTVQEVCSLFPLSDIDVCRRLWAFRTLGWIESAPPAAHEDPAAPPLVEAEVIAVEPPEQPAELVVEADLILQPEATPSPAAAPEGPPIRPPAPESAPILPAEEPAFLASSEPGAAEDDFAQGDPFQQEDPFAAPSPAPDVRDAAPERPQPASSEESGESEVVESVDADLEGLGMILGRTPTD